MENLLTFLTFSSFLTFGETFLVAWRFGGQDAQINGFRKEFKRKLIGSGRRPESGKSGFGSQGSKINDF